MVVRLSSSTITELIERLTPMLMEPAWVTRNRVEARLEAMATARKLANETLDLLLHKDAKQVAPAAILV